MNEQVTRQDKASNGVPDFLVREKKANPGTPPWNNDNVEPTPVPEGEVVGGVQEEAKLEPVKAKH